MCSFLKAPKIDTKLAPNPTNLPDKAPDPLVVKPESEMGKKRGNPLRIDLASNTPSTPSSGVKV